MNLKKVEDNESCLLFYGILFTGDEMKKILQWMIIIIGSIGIVLEFVGHEFIATPDTSFDGLTLFKYFTIQSNILVVVYFFLLNRMFVKNKRFDGYLVSVTFTIMITGLMFFLFLDKDYDPVGIRLISSTILHYVNPILVVVYCVLYVKEIHVDYKDILLWMVYPLLYLVFVVISGVIFGDYIYPFFDVYVVGVLGFLMTSSMLFVSYFVLSFVIVKIVSQKNVQNLK